MDQIKRVTAALVGPADFVVRSPGRINIIGEHLDYNGGLVLPGAIDKAIWFAVRRIPEAEWRLRALDIDDGAVVKLPVGGRTDQLWVDYLSGIGAQFQGRGHFLPGLEMAFGGNLPSGAGVSSSAALEGGMTFILDQLLGTQLSRPDMARICQESSNHYLGIPSGIMDQFASLNGRATGPIVLNCDTLVCEPVKNAIEGYDLLLVNSMVTHELGNSEYPVRVAECRRALAAIQSRFPKVEALAWATTEQLNEIMHELSEVEQRRASYVIRENLRVTRAVSALETGSATELGRLLNATHAGLRDDYEVSCAEIDFLQEQATVTFNEQNEGAVAGARLMGGGFGGCTLNLVATGQSQTLQQYLTEAYRSAFGIIPEFYPVHFAEGTNLAG